MGLSNVLLSSVNRDSGRPMLIAWFCSGHSPPLSHTGQSRGWLSSRNSMTPSCASRATSELSCVRTCMPSETTWAQAGCGLGTPSISIRHARQAATGSSSGWSQKRGISIPSISAARITRVPAGTDTATPSTMTLTRSGLESSSAPGSLVMVIEPPLPRRCTKRRGRTARRRRCEWMPRILRGSTSSPPGTG